VTKPGNKTYLTPSAWQVVLDAGPVEMLKCMVNVSCFYHTML